MSRIAVVAPPTAGHLYPLLGVVTELVRRGHSVGVPVAPAFTAAVAETGAQPLPYLPMVGPVGAHRLTWTGDDVVRALQLVLRETRATLPQLAAAFRSDTPELVVHDGPESWAGRLLGAAWGVPTVATLPVFAANAHWSPAGRYIHFNPDHPALPMLLAELTELLSGIGLAPNAEAFLYGPPVADQTVVLLPRAFQPAGDTFGTDHHFVGPCPGARRFQGGWEPPHSGRPVVLVTLGTTYHRNAAFFRSFLHAIADAEVHAVLAVGDPDLVGAVGRPPVNAEVHARVPQLQVLRHADLLVCHGGMGTVMEGLLHGVPLVAAPQMPEHRLNSDRVVELGLGRSVDGSDAAVLRGAVLDGLADDRSGRRAAALREHIRTAGGPAAAADVVEELLGRAPAPRCTQEAAGRANR